MTTAGRPEGTVVFFHAHPDDEAIFTGGTIAALTGAGRRVVVVLATDGQLGDPGDGPGGCAAVGRLRRAEAEEAAEVLGVDRLVLLGHHDSGSGRLTCCRATPFAALDPAGPADALARVLADEDAESLVLYDDGGMYGHPDHVQVHHVGTEAARRAGLGTSYEATVDREYLHFVDTHLVELAHTAYDAPVPLGVPTVEVSTTVDVRPWLAQKVAAMAAHRSQVPPGSPAISLAPELFAAVYGFEWYLRAGPPHCLEQLPLV